MRPCNKQPNLGSSFQEAPAHWPGRQIGGIPSIGTLRLFNVLESAVRQSVGCIFHWRRRRTAARKLQVLNDHYLKDIGLDRSQIVSSFEEIIETGGQKAARIARRNQWRL